MPPLQLQASEQVAPVDKAGPVGRPDLVRLAYELAPLFSVLLIVSQFRRIWRARISQQR
jgi:hypothetical protein